MRRWCLCLRMLWWDGRCSFGHCSIKVGCNFMLSVCCGISSSFESGLLVGASHRWSHPTTSIRFMRDVAAPLRRPTYLGLWGSSKHLRVCRVDPASTSLPGRDSACLCTHFVFFCSSLLVDSKYTRETQWVRWIFTQIFNSLAFSTPKRLNELWTWKISS